MAEFPKDCLVTVIRNFTISAQKKEKEGLGYYGGGGVGGGKRAFLTAA